MRLSTTLFLLTLLLSPIALLGTTWLYLYPIFHSCQFPVPPPQYADPNNNNRAPFRLLSLGDPQLEGDSSLPKPDALVFPSLEYLLPHLENAESNKARVDMLWRAISGVVKEDVPKWLEGKRKTVDLWGNDWYLAHIVRATRWWSRPTHVAVLGDLLGSQWITEGEFERRAGRFWGVVMRGLGNVPGRNFGIESEEMESEDAGHHSGHDGEQNGGAGDELGENVEWDLVEDTEEDADKDVKEDVIQDVKEDPGNDEKLETRNAAEASEGEEDSTTERQETDTQTQQDTIVDDGKQDKGESEQSGERREQFDALKDITEGHRNEQEHGEDSEHDRRSEDDVEHEHKEDTQDELVQTDHVTAESEQSSERSELFDALQRVVDDLRNEQEHRDQRAEDDHPPEHHVENGQEDHSTNELDQTDHVNGDGSPEPEQEESKKPLRKPSWGGTTETLGADEDWANRAINIAGNHDVGYAGDIDEHRIERFEKAFGSVNWDIWFELPEHLRNPRISGGRGPDPMAGGKPPALRLVILNSMNLDTPAWNSELQTETYSFMNHIITSARPVEDKTHATVLLTHIPLEKQAGICVDAPYFNFFDEGHGVREQNMLSDFSTKTILEGIFGMNKNPFAAGSGFGRRGIILNGHDHAGCDTVHFIQQDNVLDHCKPSDIKKEEAYWPIPTSSTAPTETTIPTTTPHLEPTSPANPFLLESSPAPPPATQESSPEQDSDDTQLNTGWLAHRFPHRPYHISHSPSSNTTTCTSITEAPHIREITLRSMMGEFSGYAGFLSAWFDTSKGDYGEWVFEFQSCGVGIQHWWWGVHIVDLVWLVVLVGGAVVRVLEGLGFGRDKIIRSKDPDGKEGMVMRTNGSVAGNGGIKGG